MKVKILGKDYKILYKSDWTPDDLHMGYSNTKAAEICIKTGMPHQVQEETILHEILHVISEELLLNLKEQQVRGISTVLYSVFPDILKSIKDQVMDDAIFIEESMDIPDDIYKNIFDRIREAREKAKDEK